MNNKGQSLVTFIMLLPLIIVVIDFFIEKINITYNETRVDNILCLACRQENIEEYLNLNDNFDEISIDIIDNKTYIITKKNVRSLLSGIVGIDKFKIKNEKICEGR